MIEKKFDIRNSNKIKNFNQKIEVDSDKSLSIRSLLFSAIAKIYQKLITYWFLKTLKQL